jgi:hypothetical protein
MKNTLRKLKYKIYFKNVPASHSVSQLIKLLNTMPLKKYSFVSCKTLSKCDAHITFLSNTEICKKKVRFCDQNYANVSGPKPRNITMNNDNWYNPPSHWNGNVIEYRRYALFHEVLHTFGLLHPKRNKTYKSKACPIMISQSLESNLIRHKCGPSAYNFSGIKL